MWYLQAILVRLKKTQTKLNKLLSRAGAIGQAEFKYRKTEWAGAFYFNILHFHPYRKSLSMNELELEYEWTSSRSCSILSTEIHKQA